MFLKPGETFSMNKVLGPRTTARGWMAGGAIDGGRVVERMGGGISQTTTTTFNAIFFAGLEDIYHKPHSLYFSRYPMGREATLDYNSVDMKFRNNTDYGVLMQAFTNNPKVGGQGSVTVRVWSTKMYDVKATDPVQSNFRDARAGDQGQLGRSAARRAPCAGSRSPTTACSTRVGRWCAPSRSSGRTTPSPPVVCTNPNRRRADRIER